MGKIIGELRQKSLFGYILAFSGMVVLIILVMGAYLYRFYYHTIHNDWVNAGNNYLSSITSRHENDMKIMDDIVLQMGLPGGNTEFKLEEVSKEELRDLIYHDGKKLKVLREQTIDGFLSLKFRSIAHKAVVYCKSVEPKNRSTMLFVVGNNYYDKLLSSEESDLRQNFIIYKDQVIVSRGSLNLDENRLVEDIKNLQRDAGELVIDGTSYLVNIQQGKSELLYCTIQSRKIFQNKIVTGQWGILFLLSVCSIPTSLAIVALSRRLSGKIRSINKLLTEDEDAYYNLETIETGIRTLVESNREMNQESLLLRRTRFISNFVRNEYASRKAAVRAGEKVNLHIDTSCFVIVLMGDRGNSNENKAHEMMLSELMMRESEDGFGIHLIQNNQSMFVIFGDDVNLISTLLERFFAIGKEYCEEFVMAVSGVHEDFENSSNAYLEAAAAFDNRFLVDNERIIHFTDVAGREQVELLPDTYVQRLKNAIRVSDAGEAENVIKEICNRMRSSQQSLLTFRIFYNDIIHMMLTEWNTKDANFGNIYNVFALSQCLTIQDFNDILNDVCHKLMDTKAVSSEKEDIVSEAIRYMKENYQSFDLNMTALAEHLNVSGVTLAVGFKNAMGISPSDYLAIIRMEHAKALLKETQLRVKEVSSMVGYEDDHVFMRRFKKYVGKTPGEYRKEEKES